MVIKSVEELAKKRELFPLLLDADPDEGMVERYLDRGHLYVLREGEQVLGEILVLPLSREDCEIKNIAVHPDFRNRGLGRKLIDHACERYAESHKRMLVGTSVQGIPFYERCGFRKSHIIEHFFLTHYPEPIYDNGILCDHMYCLERIIGAPK